MKFDKIYNNIINESSDHYFNENIKVKYRLSGSWRAMEYDPEEGDGEIVKEGEYYYINSSLKNLFLYLKNKEHFDFKNIHFTNENDKTEFYGIFYIDKDFKQNIDLDDPIIQKKVQNKELEVLMYEYTIFIEKLQFTNLDMGETSKVNKIIESLK